MAINKIEVTMEPEKETKRFWRFTSLGDDEVIDTVYIAKRAFDGTVPQRIKIAVVSDE